MNGSVGPRDGHHAAASRTIGVWLVHPIQPPVGGHTHTLVEAGENGLIWPQMAKNEQKGIYNE